MSLHGFHPELLPLPEIIRGRAVCIRPFRRGDGQALFEAVSEDRPHLRRWLPWVDHHATVFDSEAYVRRASGTWMTREDLPVALLDSEDRFIGGSGFHRIDWDSRAFEVGYWLRPSAQNHGYVTEAVQLLSAVAFDRLDATRLEIRCDPENARSAAVPERLGFLREAHLRNQSRRPDGMICDTLVYALTPESFEACAWADEARRVVSGADREG